jgi:hypothetical protein
MIMKTDPINPSNTSQPTLLHEADKNEASFTG